MKKGTTAVFAAGFLQGSAFVLIPALGSILRSAPYAMGNGTYGMLYFPEIIGAIIAALAAGSIHKRFGAHGLFRIGVLANAIAMVLLVLAFFSGQGLVVVILLAETLLLGVGFGLTNAAINRASTLIFAGSATAAVTILNGVIGAATSISPMLLHLSTVWLTWVLWPAALLLLWLLTLLLPQALEENQGQEIGGLRAWKKSMIPFAAAVVIYAICEGSFGSWANILVSVDHHLARATGAAALSLFWGGMTVARFVLGAIPDPWLSRRWVYRAAPLGMAACFLIIPQLHSATALLLCFALAGAACGIYYPYSMAFGVARHGKEGTQMAGLMVGALMVGEGIGSAGLGPLQALLSLNHIYLFSALWAIPLIWLAWGNSS
ncbi:sugar MFS transporter [Acidithiobacillus sp. IBUN Pt1247-S3]|uniref:MFS transporter n=1 Tax=Acidithiobacillus sp. IBUN Pt1247-S3 TaxID=3166642 RepID=UPI0034E56DB3